MTAAAICKPLVSRCGQEYHNVSRHLAMRANSTTRPYWDERLSGITWLSCRFCKHGMAFIERREDGR